MPLLDPLAERLERCYTGAAYDVLRTMGHANCVLPNTIRPLDPTRKLAGRIYTVSGHRKDGLDAHETLLKWTALLSKAPPDSVVVCQPNDSTLAHMGELSSETLQFRKVRGYIVDGGCRDSDFILKIGFPRLLPLLRPGGCRRPVGRGQLRRADQDRRCDRSTPATTRWQTGTA